MVYSGAMRNATPRAGPRVFKRGVLEGILVPSASGRRTSTLHGAGDARPLSSQHRFLALCRKQVLSWAVLRGDATSTPQRPRAGGLPCWNAGVAVLAFCAYR